MSETVDVLKRRDPLSDVLDQGQDHNLATILGMERGVVSRRWWKLEEAA
jgi:hypothetical protein